MNTRILRTVILALALATAALLLAACNQPAHAKDTNFSEYNYGYNR